MRYLENSVKILMDYGELVPQFITADQYKSWKHRGKIIVHGYGGNGRIVSVEVCSLPTAVQDMIHNCYGDLHEHLVASQLLVLLKRDIKAHEYYAHYIKPTGGSLPIEVQRQYARAAEWLNMVLMVTEDRKALKDLLHIDAETFWRRMLHLHQHDRPVNPELPVTYDAFRKKLNEYKTNGYAALISKKYGNQNTRKVSPKIEGLIVSLACMDHKPYLNEVCRKYRAFMTGDLKVVDMTTGEVYDPQEFYVKDAPYALGESTVDYYLKKPGNIAMIDKQRMSQIQWKAKYHPHVIRKAPMYSLSKITMDDVDMPFKDLGDKRPVKSYQIADVASGAIIGKAFSRDKDVALLQEALRDMFQTIIANGMACPMEIEMEKHLTSSLMKKGDDALTEEKLLVAGNIFPHVRVCLGGNAREKRMEHIIRHKKYEFQNKRPGFQGRFYARLMTNRLNTDQDRIRYAYEQIVQNELDDIEAHNTSLHPNQEQYPQMTRWEVFTRCQNPQAVKYPAHVVMPYIGHKVETSVRGGYIQVVGGKYSFPDIRILDKLTNPAITAYYIPGMNGIERVYVYQGDKYICECAKVVQFQEAVAEQTEADLTNMDNQRAYQQSFNQLIRAKKKAVVKLGTIKDDKVAQPTAKRTIVMPEPVAEEYEMPLAIENWRAAAARSL